VEPLELAYEDVVANSEAETLRVLDFLSVELPPGVMVRPLTHPAPKSSTDEWPARYRRELAER
jgi:LPS sulfotransferase NodH